MFSDSHTLDYVTIHGYKVILMNLLYIQNGTAPSLFLMILVWLRNFCHPSWAHALAVIGGTQASWYMELALLQRTKETFCQVRQGPISPLPTCRQRAKSTDLGQAPRWRQRHQISHPVFRGHCQRGERHINTSQRTKRQRALWEEQKGPSRPSSPALSLGATV